MPSIEQPQSLRQLNAGVLFRIQQLMQRFEPTLQRASGRVRCSLPLQLAEQHTGSGSLHIHDLLGNGLKAISGREQARIFPNLLQQLHQRRLR